MASAAPTNRMTVMQGQVCVRSQPDDLLTTVLGSCIAACVFDPDAQIGGMNHFLLSEPVGASAIDEHYGVYLMEVLVNEMLAGGAAKRRMKAHLYGGANLHAGMQHIGTVNAAFAKAFLEREGIPISHSDVGGTSARRVEFMPALGRARCRIVNDAGAFTILPTRRPSRSTGDVELF